MYDIPLNVSKALHEVSVLLETFMVCEVEDDIEKIFKTNKLSSNDTKILYDVRYSAPIPFVDDYEVQTMKKICNIL